MREVVLDTETTGLDPNDGHRICEIGCIELVNHVATESHFHQYINPERDMPEAAYRVHGLSTEFLSEKPRFVEVADRLIDFLGDAPLIIHNAEFDMGFINAELRRIDRSPLPFERAVDTVKIARRKFPGAQASLDALCRRFQIDNSARTLHGALLDAELLAEVYLELIGGRQPDFDLAQSLARTAARAERKFREPRPHAPTEDELRAHQAFIESLTDPIWSK